MYIVDYMDYFLCTEPEAEVYREPEKTGDVYLDEILEIQAYRSFKKALALQEEKKRQHREMFERLYQSFLKSRQSFRHSI